MPRKDKYDIHKIRKQVKDKVGKHSDPTEFRPPKAEDGKPPIKFRFYILPPFEMGEELTTGPAERGMDEFFLRNGSHYINNRRHGCPRVINDDDCDICQHGFDLMSETDDRDRRRDIAQRLLPGTYYMVNIYFPNIQPNPEELRGQVRWYNCPKGVFDVWEDCLFRDDDGGDPAEPLPYGVFYDEEDAYLFQLEVVKQGQANNYGKSKFIVTDSMKTRPLAGKPDAPDEAKIAEILAKRHCLFDKLPDVSRADIERIARDLTGDTDGSGGFDQDETKKEDKATTRKRKEAERKAKKGLKPEVSESSASAKPESDGDLSELVATEDAAKSGNEPVSGEVPAEDAPFDADGAKAAKGESTAVAADDDDDVDALLSQLSEDD